MKRLNNLYEKVISIDNLLMADQIARKGKSKQAGIKEFDKNWEQNIADIYRDLVTHKYKTGNYRVFTIYEPKERIIYSLPYRDRIVHHAIMNVLEPMFINMFTADTYACIKGKGIHAGLNSMKLAMKDEEGTKYCLKMDIKKFYPSIDRDILKWLLRRKIKDQELLRLLDGIIDSAEGLPIGNYLSQYFANFYFCYLDHWIKEELRVKNYWRYCDDLVILCNTKKQLHQIRVAIMEYLSTRLNLVMKKYQVFPVAKRGIDFLGYVIRHTYVLMRKSIKKNFARMVYKSKRKTSKKDLRASIASYKGWAKHCNSNHLLKKLLPHENIPAIRNRNNHPSINRGQNKNQQSIEQGSQSTRLQDYRFQLRRQRQKARFADRT